MLSPDPFQRHWVNFQRQTSAQQSYKEDLGNIFCTLRASASTVIIFWKWDVEVSFSINQDNGEHIETSVRVQLPE